MQKELKAVKAQNEALVTIQKSIYAGSAPSGVPVKPQKASGEDRSVENSGSGISEGKNQGFLVKGGRSGKVKIEVIPVKNKEE
jgi:hypothetical protein